MAVIAAPLAVSGTASGKRLGAEIHRPEKHQSVPRVKRLPVTGTVRLSASSSLPSSSSSSVSSCSSSLPSSSLLAGSLIRTRQSQRQRSSGCGACDRDRDRLFGSDRTYRDRIVAARVTQQEREEAAPITADSADQNLLERVCSFLRKFIPMKEHTVTNGDVEVREVMVDEALAWSGRTVFVAGGTGKTGRRIVDSLVERRDKVVLLASSKERVNEVFPESATTNELGWNRRVVIVEGDIGDEDVLRRGLEGCDAVICAVGVRFTEGGGPRQSAEDLYAKGISKFVRIAAAVLEDKSFDSSSLRKEHPLFSFIGPDQNGREKQTGTGESDDGTSSANKNGGDGAKETNMEGWARLDDVIMGGISESSFKLSDDGGAVFEGIVRVEGGGFCAARGTIPEGLTDLSGYDGLCLRVRGDGQRYKINLKTKMDKPEFTYQASFDTVRGEWVSVDIPFDRFRAVLRANLQPDSAPLPKDSINTLGLVISRFEYDGMANYLFTPGHFKLEVEWIRAYRNPRPQFVLISSAGVERSARAVTPEQREKSIPIVKLNPGGVLTWKLLAEDALRASGLTYTIIRPCGLNDNDDDIPCPLEVAQGDVITGLIPRKDVANLCLQALESPNTGNVTFEVRRDPLALGLLQQDLQPLFDRLRPDKRPRPVIYASDKGSMPPPSVTRPGTADGDSSTTPKQKEDKKE